VTDAPPQSALDQLSVPDEQQARQATASLAGYVYQTVRTASTWSRLDDEARLLVEVAEDYATLARNVLTMTQVKNEAGSVTLRSDGVRKALASLAAFRTANPGIVVRLVYLTTAEPGTEAGSDLPGKTGGITYWREVLRGADIEPLRALLIETQTNDGLLDYLRAADAATLRTEFIERVEWLTGSEPLGQSYAALEARFRLLAADRSGFAADGERAVPFAVHHILRTAISEQRVLTRADFEAMWAAATTMAASFTFMRQASAAMAGGAGSAIGRPAPPLPALPARLAPRSALVDELLETLARTDVLWIHGSSGLGKSQLARLIAARGNARWEHVSLKDCELAECEARVRDAIANIGTDGFAGLILDDVTVPAPEGLRRWLNVAACEIAATPGARIIVTAEREPLPQVTAAFEPLSILNRDAPYLLESDVADIVTAAGGDAASWAAILHLTCGAGHPLLVDARVVGLASRGWPDGDQFEGLGVGGIPSEIEAVRREVSLRLLGELSDEAHRLLLRLGGLVAPFDRSLVQAAATVAPPVSRAGPLFDLLVGPWIEQVRDDRFSPSPLVIGAEGTRMSEGEREAVHHAAIADLLKRNPFPGDLLAGLSLYAIMLRDLPAFRFLIQVAITTSDRRSVAGSLIPLLFMRADADGVLLAEQPGISLLLRTAQLAIAVNLDETDQVSPIFRAAMAENDRAPVPLVSANRFMLLSTALSSERAKLPPRFWMPVLGQYRDLIAGGTVPDELSEVMASTDLGGLRPDQFFFVIRSNKIDTISELEEIFAALDALDPVWRRELLSAAPTLLKGPPMFIALAWTTPGLAGTLDAAAAADVYARLADQAHGWGEGEAAVECFRSRAVMFDEYLGDREKALEVLDGADAIYPGDERLKRSRATVLGNMGRHAEELAILSELTPDYSQDEPLERIMMLRSAAISAAKVGDFDKAADLFDQTYAACGLNEPQTLGLSVPPGLLVDSACIHMRAGRVDEALVRWRDALRLIDTHLGSSDPLLVYAQAAADHALQWATARSEGIAFESEIESNPGTCSTLQPKFERSKLGERQPLRGWYLLARLEAVLGRDVSGADLLALERAQGIDIGLAGGVSLARIEQASAALDADRFLAELPRYASLWAAISRNRANFLSLRQAYDDVIRLSLDSADELLSEIGRSAVSAAIGHFLMAGRAEEAIALAERARHLSPGFGPVFPVDSVLPSEDFVIAGIASLRRLVAGDAAEVDVLFQNSVQAFLWARYVGIRSLAPPLHTLLVSRWQDMTRNRRAELSLPRLSVPAIEAAFDDTPTIGAIARLLRAAALASTRPLPRSIQEAIRAAAE
jgi:hypothetical protein